MYKFMYGFISLYKLFPFKLISTPPPLQVHPLALAKSGISDATSDNTLLNVDTIHCEL